LWLWYCDNTSSIHHHKFMFSPKRSTIQTVPSNPRFIHHNCPIPLQFVTLKINTDDNYVSTTSTFYFPNIQNCIKKKENRSSNLNE
jgi:hypothetical protein